MYKFIKDDGVSRIEHTLWATTETWMEAVTDFQIFLKGCGFIFDEGFDMAAVLEEAHDKLLEERKLFNVG
jgi:hypothetical protein